MKDSLAYYTVMPCLKKKRREVKVERECLPYDLIFHLSHGEEIRIARAVNEETSKYYHQASPKDEGKNKKQKPG